MEMKGFTYGYDGKRGDFRSEGGIKSQELLYQTGVNWVCLAVQAAVTEISWQPLREPIHMV